MTQPQNDNERVRGYLVGQANKLSLPELVEKVRTDALPLREAAAAIPAERLGDHPIEGEWSAAEVWTHILDMNEHGARSVPAIIARGELPERARDTISGETRAGLKTGQQYYEVFLLRREELLARVLQAKGDEHLDVKINHSMFGDLNWREWLLFMRVHDLDHLGQLRKIAAALGS
ncbi:MAG TPA: DinB family protein [Tepidiformaceae bacterium]